MTWLHALIEQDSIGRRHAVHVVVAVFGGTELWTKSRLWATFEDLWRWHHDVLRLVVVSGTFALILGFLGCCLLVAILKI